MHVCKTISIITWLQIVCLLFQNSQSLPFMNTGPSECSNTDGGSTLIGYSDLVVLNEDMYSEAFEVIVQNEIQKEAYVYTVCPGTTFDFDALYNETGSEQYIVPYLSNVTFVCGDGDGDDDCTFFGGDSYHIFFVPQFIVLNVKVIGFTFTNNLYTSIAAFGHPLSYANFHNCTWVDNNFDMFAVDIYYDPSKISDRRRRRHRDLIEEEGDELWMMESASHNYKDLLPYLPAYYSESYSTNDNMERRALGYPAMLLRFNQSYFLDNYATSIINNEGGILDLQQTTFADNRVFLAVVDVLFGGHLVMRNNTSFTSNTITFVPVFLDSTSMLQLNTDVTGSGQITLGSDGADCLNGIFIEDVNSYCLHGGNCLGSCCDFGDDSCDMYVPNDTTFKEMDAPSPTGDMTSNSNIVTQKSNHNLEFQPPSSVTVTNKNTKAMSSSTFNGIIASVVCLSIVVILMLGLFARRWKKQRDVQLGNEPEHQIA